MENEREKRYPTFYKCSQCGCEFCSVDPLDVNDRRCAICYELWNQAEARAREYLASKNKDS